MTAHCHTTAKFRFWTRNLGIEGKRERKKKHELCVSD